MNLERIKRIEKKYPLALRLSFASRMEVVKWYISWQINNPNNKVKW